MAVNVVVLSFVENEHWAAAWIDETNMPYPLLMDRDKRSYQAFGLENSVAGAWSLRTLWFYTKAFFSGRQLKGIKGDPNQLGGDFIIDQSGKLSYIYRSKASIDRPAIEDVLQELRKLNP